MKWDTRTALRRPFDMLSSSAEVNQTRFDLGLCYGFCTGCTLSLITKQTSASHGFLQGHAFFIACLNSPAAESLRIAGLSRRKPQNMSVTC